MPAYSLNCPECRTTLKSSKPIPAGTVLDCPKCGLLVLGGGGALAWWLLSGGGDEPLAYVPPDSQIVVGIDGPALFNPSLGPKIEELLNSPALGPFAKYKQDTQAQARDLFRRVVI